MSDVNAGVLLARLLKASVKRDVVLLCNAYPSCKGDYRQLCYRYLRLHGIKITFRDFDQLLRVASPDTVCRRYRELVEENGGYDNPANPYTPSEETLLKRRKNRVVHAEYYAPEVKAVPLVSYI